MTDKANSSAGQSDTSGAVVEIPIGLKAEEMKLSNPVAVQEIEKTAGDKAKAEEQKRTADLLAAFPADAPFAQEAIGKGWTVIEAKAARHDTLVARVTELETENTQLREKSKQPVAEYASSDMDAKAQVESEDAFDKKAAAIWNKHAQVRDVHRGNRKGFEADLRHNPETYAQFN